MNLARIFVTRLTRSLILLTSSCRNSSSLELDWNVNGQYMETWVATNSFKMAISCLMFAYTLWLRTEVRGAHLRLWTTIVFHVISAHYFEKLRYLLYVLHLGIQNMYCLRISFSTLYDLHFTIHKWKKLCNRI